jgi:lipoate-protein ligase A
MPAARLLIEGICRHGDAAANMDADTRLLERIGECSSAVAAIRIYGWDKPSITYGYHQDPSRAFDLPFCETQGIPVIRRPTGGRGILHRDDLTVAVCAPISGRLAGLSVSDSSRLLASPIRRALELVGCPTSEVALATQKLSPRRGASYCFSLSLPGDILVDGRKAVGSAQVRRKGLILQQMNIPLGNAPDPLLGACFRPRASLVPGLPVSWEVLCQQILAAYAEFVPSLLLAHGNTQYYY